MKRPSLYFGILCAALIFSFGSCGSDSRADRGDESERRATAQSNVVPPACFEASTRIGGAPGRIDYVVHCRSRSPDNQPAFGIGRYSLSGKSSPPGFRHVGRHPRVSGPGVTRPFGVCSRSGSVIYCSAPSDGTVTVEGSVWVSPAKRCSRGVSVTAPLVRRCSSRDCAAQGGREVLIDGRPDGCA